MFPPLRVLVASNLYYFNHLPAGLPMLVWVAGSVPAPHGFCPAARPVLSMHPTNFSLVRLAIPCKETVTSFVTCFLVLLEDPNSVKST